MTHERVTAPDPASTTRHAPDEDGGPEHDHALPDARAIPVTARARDAPTDTEVEDDG